MEEQILSEHKSLEEAPGKDRGPAVVRDPIPARVEVFKYEGKVGLRIGDAFAAFTPEQAMTLVRLLRDTANQMLHERHKELAKERRKKGWK